MQNRSECPINLEKKQLPADFPLQCLHYTQQYRTQAALHYHDCLEIGRCVSGSGMMFWDGALHSFSADTLHVLPQGCVHDSGILPSSPDDPPSVWRYLFVDLNRLGIPLPHMHGAAVQDPMLLRLFDLIFDITVSALPGWQDELLHLLHVLVSQLQRLEPDTAPGRDDPSREAILLVQHRIATEYASDLTVEGLARSCSMSVSHFRRQFTRLAGIGPQEYLIQTRLSVAAHLLQNTSDKIITIAQKAGFRTLSSFNRLFRSHYGWAPGAYRR